MTICDLPAELLTAIFEHVVNDDSLLDPFHSTSMSLSRWDRRPAKCDWILVSPNGDAYSKQTRVYAATKAIMFTCKQWYRISYYLLFRCLFLSDIIRLRPLCAVLDRCAWLGWYVKRIHLVRYYAPRRVTMADVETTLATVIHHCPNLELFTVEWQITPAIAHSLVTYCARSLRSVQWKIDPDCLAGLIWALDALPSLVSMSIDFETLSISITSPSDASETPEDTSPLLGTASHISLTLNSLQQLTVRGLSQEFIEQAIGWSFPVLQSFTLDFAAHRNDLPDVGEFLKHHGTQLTFLDLNTIPTLDLPGILAACPMLTSFSFNPDWRLPIHTDWSVRARLLQEPHTRITHLGLHQLLDAFLTPSLQSANDDGLPQLATMMLQHTNDLTFSQLTRQLFPALKVVRVLNRTLLAGLKRQDGPKDEGYARWQFWEAQCHAEGVRLEDCTGALLGEEWEEESEGEYEYEYEGAGQEQVQELKLTPSIWRELRESLNGLRMSSAEPAPFLPEEAFAAALQPSL